MIINVQPFFDETEDTTALDPHSQEIEAALFVFSDESYTTGKIVIERSSYGVYIHINNRCLAMVDLYHFGPEHKESIEPAEPSDFPRIIFYTGNEADDPVGTIAWHSAHTEIHIDRSDIRQQHDRSSHTYIIDEQAG